MSETMAIAPVVKSVDVRRPLDDAFRIFTRELGTWWPTGDHSISGDVREVVWEEREGGEVYEVSAAGERAHWATVLTWEPPRRLVLAWKVDPARAETEIEVRFTGTDGGTRVELTHRGFEAWAAQATEGRDSYDAGWDHVLGRFVAQAAG
jgi:hypothetical protein